MSGLALAKVFVIASGLVAAAALLLLAPVIAAGVLGLGLGYSALYVIAAAASVLGSVLVTRIRSLA